MSDIDTVVATEPPEESSPTEVTRDAMGGGAKPDSIAGLVGGALGRYVVLGQLGSGGMGTVLKAYDESLDRAIAIKLLHAGAVERHAQRLTREAQALAKLSHPNIVHVYEVSQSGDQWFIAMELVRGQTLRQWQRANREWRDCIAVYQQAGAGLVAAHAAGLVHRDFKPDNCIIDEQGRPRVLDFGLVREIEAPSTDGSVDASDVAEEVDREGLTAAGSVVGTVAYMPLEQLSGKPTDARSDQFSFCVSLYEALYKERPFSGESVGQLTLSLTEGAIRPPPRGTRVPARLRRALLRGLSNEPEQRWPSMAALLTELQQIAAPRARMGLTVVVGAGLLTLSVAVWGRSSAHEEPPPCQGAQTQLDGVWDEGRKQAVEAAILGTELPYAPDTWERIAPRLDDYAAAWVAKHTEVCEATSVRQEQSTEVMDLRMECLRGRLVSLRDSVEILTQANKGRVQEAVKLVAGLPTLSRCDDVDALRAMLPPPEDPDVAEQVGRQRERLARANQLNTIGEYDEALALAKEAVNQAEALDYAPLKAEALHNRAENYSDKAQYAEAEQDLKQSYIIAAEIGHDIAEVNAASLSTFVVGWQQARHAEGLLWGTIALALARGPHATPDLEGTALSDIATIYGARGDFVESLTHYRRALEVMKRTYGPEDHNTANMLSNIGLVLSFQGEFSEALRHHRQALAIFETALGPRHPNVAMSLTNIGLALRSQGELDEALAAHERALAIREEAQESGHPDVAYSLNNIGAVYGDRGQLPEALEYFQRALDIWEQTVGPNHPTYLSSLSNIGLILSMQGKLSEALSHHRHALAIRKDVLGPDHPDVAMSLKNIGDVLEQQGQLAKARSSYKRAVAIYDELEDSNPGLSGALVGLAKVTLEQQDFAAARVHAERAVELRESGEGSPENLAEARFVLARVLWDDRAERPRARQLAQQARDAYAKIGERVQDELRAVETWLSDTGTSE